MKYLKVYENFQSDKEIYEICKKYEIENYTIKNGLVYVDGDVDLSRNSFTKLPIKFGEVTGIFTCNNNQLTSLEGCPKKVGSYFDCNNNKLTSLEGGPSEVGGFYCSRNELTSLEGCPSKVGGDFFCAYNNLTSLYGCASEVLDFNCSYNQLTSLEGCPEKVVGNFSCAYNKKIYDFIGIDYIGGYFYYRNTILEEIWNLFEDESKIELINYIDPFRPTEVEGDKPICYLDRLNSFLKQIGKPTVTKLKNYECR